VENPELMFDNVLEFGQPEAAAHSRMKGGQCTDPRDRTVNCQHSKKTSSRKTFRAEIQVKCQPGIWRKSKNCSM